jgi:ribosomal protein S18 acetylase RimI-like enzyme
MIELHSASLAHEDEILKLATAFHLEDGHPLRPSSAGAIQSLLMGSPLGVIYRIQESQNTIGYCALCFTMSLEFGGQVVILDDLYLKPEFRNRGQGRKVLHEVERIARALGAVQIFLEVERANEGAMRLYRREGFFVRNRFMMEKTF